MAEVEDARHRESAYFEQLSAQARRRAAFHSLALESSIIAGHPVKAIAGFTKPQRFDLLVLGTSNRSALYGQLWGGASHSLARGVPCSVLIVK
jgi:nucleotide-binding universal stress UspA family protein